MFPFGCVFCLSRLAGRIINISNDSIKKMFRYVRFPSGKIAEGKSVMWGKRLHSMAFSTKLG